MMIKSPIFAMVFLAMTFYPFVSFASELEQEANSWHEQMQSPCEGVILGQIANETIEFAAAGRVSQQGPLVDKDTLFEIGSITKVFTGILLADTVLQKKATLSDPIYMYLQEVGVTDDNPIAKITLLELATHTSGLPRLPSDFFKDSDPKNPYDHYTLDKLFQYLATFDRNDFGESGKYRYSNLGFALLGEILAHINNTTYAELLQETILDPLNMRDTFVQVSLDTAPSRLRDKIAVGNNQGKPTAHWSLRAFAGAGGIVSSAKDLLIFANAQWDVNTPVRLQNAFKLASRKYTEEMGLGWHITSKGLSHDGGTGGFRTQLDVSFDAKTAKVSLRNGTGPQLEIVRRGNFKELAGFWQGTLDSPRRGKLRVVMRLTSEGFGSIYSIDQGGFIIPALKTEIENRQFFSFFPKVNGIFSGAINDGKSITGTWEQNGKIPLEMEKSDTLPSSLENILKNRFHGNFGPLIGFWSGHLGNDAESLVVCQVEKLGEVYELNIWSPDQSPLPIAVTKASFHNDELYVEIGSIKGNFTGKLSEDRKTISGIWRQGQNTDVILQRSAVQP